MLVIIDIDWRPIRILQWPSFNRGNYSDEDVFVKKKFRIFEIILLKIPPVLSSVLLNLWKELNLHLHIILNIYVNKVQLVDLFVSWCVPKKRQNIKNAPNPILFRFQMTVICCIFFFGGGGGKINKWRQKIRQNIVHLTCFFFQRKQT